MSTKAVNYEKKYKTWIWIVSILIPVVVALLFMVRIPDVAPLTFLPPIYAVINGITAIVLMIAYWAIRQKNISLHEHSAAGRLLCELCECAARPRVE